MQAKFIYRSDVRFTTAETMKDNLRIEWINPYITTLLIRQRFQEAGYWYKSSMGLFQGVWNRREVQMTRPALPYDYTCIVDGTSFE